MNFGADFGPAAAPRRKPINDPKVPTLGVTGAHAA
jgi:hypothetical protein